jgi:hypothetical protein
MARGQRPCQRHAVRLDVRIARHLLQLARGGAQQLPGIDFMNLGFGHILPLNLGQIFTLESRTNFYP